ncbi:MAG: hypothetical protein PHS24_02235 [Bacilli bacterium]|nr:hypothetical protein [Bacilli bacterium]
MKLGGDSISIGLKNVIYFKIGILTFLGFVFYMASFLLWQKLLVTFDLTYIIPLLTGIMQIVVLLIGYCIFKENINIYNIIGITVIGVGVLLIGIK